MKKVVSKLLLILLMVVIAPVSAYADLNGTTLNTSISTTTLNMEYNSGSGTQQEEVVPTVDPITVAQICGIDQSVFPSDESAAAAGTVIYTFQYENIGNASDALVITKGNIGYSGESGVAIAELALA